MSRNQPESLGAAAVRPMPGPTEVPWNRLTTIAVVLLIIGVVGFAVALSVGASQRAWEAWLVNLLFFLGIAQGGVIVSCAFYLTQARWAGTVHYRLAESFAAFLPLGFLLFWGVFIGRDYIFPWITHPIPAAKAEWLNVPFLFTRDGIILALMAAISWWFVSASRGQAAQEWAKAADTIEMPPPTIRRLAPIIGILYCFLYSILAVDLIMSLSPQWKSTLFGWWYFETDFWSAIVAMAFTAVIFRKALGPRNTFTNGKVRHDLAKMVFAFSIFWIYLSFAQYLVIWYGDMPLETFFLVVRLWHWPWSALSWFAPLLIWVVPFIFLMGVRPKRTPAILGTVAVLGLVGVWILNYILIVPSISPNHLPFGWVEACITAGFLGAFLLCAQPGLKLTASSAASGMDGGE